MRKQKIAVFTVGFVIILASIFLRPDRIQQHKFDTTLHILIDRAPGGLLPGQALDVMGRRFTPLLEFYALLPQSQSDIFEFKPKNDRSDLTPLEFTVIRDENSRALKLLRGEADLLFDSVAISKTEWLKKQSSPGFRVFSHSGLNLSYLGFSLRHPILKNKAVRLAIAQSLPVSDWVRHKLANWVDVSNEFIQLPYDPENSKKELDRLGYPVRADGTRFQLRYHTTGVREGAEMALLVQEALKKIGVAVEIVTLDNLLYFQKMKKGEADLFSTRWFRASEQEPIAEFLLTEGSRNYFGFSNSKIDQKLRKNPVLSPTELSKLLDDEFPFFPLYNWKHGLILGPRVKIENETRLVATLDESFRFLTLLGLK